MWFKNMQIFTLEDDFSYSANEFNEALQQERLQNCGQLEKFNLGWCNPLGDDDENFFVHAYKDCFLIALGKNERLLPASVVRDALIERIKEIKNQEARDVFSREKANLRDEITFELLPKAFTKTSRTYAYIDKKNKWLIIDSASHKKAEEFCSFLRDTLGGLRMQALPLPENTHSVMSNWLLDHQSPPPFLIEDCCELIDVKSGVGSIKCNQQDLSATEISNHIRAGKQVVSMTLTWADKIYFMLCDDLSIKRIKPLDIIEQRLKDELIENEFEKHAADFAIMSSEFSTMLQQIFTLFAVEKKTFEEAIA